MILERCKEVRRLFKEKSVNPLRMAVETGICLSTIRAFIGDKHTNVGYRTVAKIEEYVINYVRKK